MRVLFSIRFLALFCVIISLVKAVSVRERLRIEQAERERIKALTEARYAAHTSSHGNHYPTSHETYDHSSNFVNYDYQQGLQEHIPSFQQENFFHYNNPVTHATQFNPSMPAQDGRRFRRQRSRRLVINKTQREEEKEEDDDAEEENEITPPISEHNESTESEYEPEQGETTESDQEISASHPIRSRITRRRHGKGLATTPLHDEKSDTTDDDHHPGLRKFKSLNMIGDASSTPQRKDKQPLEESFQQAEGGITKEKFKRVWRQLGLGPHLSPKQLADQSALIRIPGLSHRAKGAWSKEIANSYSANEADHAEFEMQQSRINKQAYAVRKRMARNESFQGMDPEDLYYLALEQTIAHFNEAPKPSKYGHTSIVIQRANARQETVNQVGNFVISYLESQGKDLSQLTIDQLDEMVRKNKICAPDMNLNVFTAHYFRWLEKNLKIPKEEVDILRFARMKKRTELKNKEHRRHSQGDQDSAEE